MWQRKAGLPQTPQEFYPGKLDPEIGKIGLEINGVSTRKNSQKRAKGELAGWAQNSHFSRIQTRIHHTRVVKKFTLYQDINQDRQKIPTIPGCKYKPGCIIPGWTQNSHYTRIQIFPRALPQLFVVFIQVPSSPSLLKPLPGIPLLGN